MGTVEPDETKVNISIRGFEAASLIYESSAPWIWFNNAIIPREAAVESVLCQAIHYGSGGFEGERLYVTPAGPALFRNYAHKARLIYSTTYFLNDEQVEIIKNGGLVERYTPEAMYELAEKAKFDKAEFPLKLMAEKNNDIGEYGVKELVDATHAILALNDIDKSYVRPVFWMGGGGGLKLVTIGKALRIAIAPLPWKTYLKLEDYEKGLDVLVSPWPRIDHAMPVDKKMASNYGNSSMHANLSKSLGYGEALVLNHQGKVVEGSAENIFVLIGNTVYTPPLSSNLLAGITRDSIIQILHKMGVPVEYEALSLSEVCGADAVWMTGTAAELIHVKSISEYQGLAKRVDALTMLSEEKANGEKVKKVEFEPLKKPLTHTIQDGKRPAIVKEVQDRFQRVIQLKDPDFSERWMDLRDKKAILRAANAVPPQFRSRLSPRQRALIKN